MGSMEHLKAYIRSIPDFPQPGILFRDMTPLLQHAPAFREVIQHLLERYRQQAIEAVVAIESRGFFLGAALAYELRTGLVPVRKAGRLPFKTFQASYTLEYGENVVEIHQDALRRGQRVLLTDDLLATGGTMQAALSLVSRFGATVVETAFLVELAPLGGRARLAPHAVYAMITYD